MENDGLVHGNNDAFNIRNAKGLMGKDYKCCDSDGKDTWWVSAGFTKNGNW